MTKFAVTALALGLVFPPSRAFAGANDAPSTQDVEPAQEGFDVPDQVELASPLTIDGYIDAGYAKAAGNGSSFPANDQRLPADYGVDPFAPAVNTRGDVASTNSDGRFTNGFYPRSTNIGGNGSFLVNTLSVDLKYETATAPLLMFARVQALPRLDEAGTHTQLYVDQAFGRLAPIKGQELFISVGKFDSVFGIEYLDRQAPIRVGITPSLLARYTMGTSIGARASYRYQLAPLWSALTLNASATNSGTFDDALKPPEGSLTGSPTWAARLGYELNLPRVQIKLGTSGSRGARNDQTDANKLLKMWGADARLFVAGLSLSGEYVHVDEDESDEQKHTGLGLFPVASGFHARGFWAQAAYQLPFKVKLTPYFRYDRRHAWFDGFRPLTVDRFTLGARLELWRQLAMKAEFLRNREVVGAPKVPNDVFTSSLVFYW